jgi:integrase
MIMPKKILNYRGGHIRALPSGTYDTYINAGGKQYRKRFKHVEMAKAWIDAFAPNDNLLTQRQMEDATAAYAILPEGTLLLDVARAYLENLNAAPTTQQDLLSLATAFIAERQAELRKSTLENYRRVLNHTIARFESLTEITTESLREWTATMTPHNKNRALRALSAFYSWLIERNHASINPTANIKLAKVDAPSRQVLSIEDTQTLLNTALTKDKRLIPYLALCLFAGLRPDECKQLTPAHLTRDYIRIGEAIAKTHAARTVPIHDNLAKILAKYPIPPNGVMHGLSPDRFKKNLSALIKASGIQWANDIMRHSYASYEYERTRDAAATAANMGHTGTDLFFRHYRGLVEPKTGAQYFSITI